MGACCHRKENQTMNTISTTLAKLAASALLVIAFAVTIPPALALEPLVCWQEVSYNPVENTYDCIIKCVGDDDGCPDCCPPGGGGGGGNSAGGDGTKGAHGTTGVSGGPCKASCGNGNGPGAGGGDEEQCCEEEEGMARWSVKQPRLNVFLNDKP